MAKGTNIGIANTPVSPTLWIREIDPDGSELALSAECTGSPPTTANVFQHGCLMVQKDSGTGTNAVYQNTGSSAVPAWTLLDTAKGGGATSLVDTNNVTAMDVGTTASAVNNVRVTDAATGSGPSLSAVGSDTNIPITVKGKGTGAVMLGQATSTDVRLLADQPLADSSGNPYIKFTKATTAVNQITVANSATGTGVSITATGSDTDIALSIAPKGAGVYTVGAAAGTGDVIVGSSSAGQSVKIANGAGAPTVNVANVSTAGATVTIAGAATATGNTDTIAIATGNAAGTGAKVVNIATGTPNTSGNNKVTLGGGTTSAVTFNAVMCSYQTLNYIATESGSNNAIAATLTDASGNNVTVAAGLCVRVLLAHSLQAGANTFNLNSHGTDAIKSHRNPSNDIGTAYVSGGIVELMFDGTQWQDMSQ